MDFDYSEDQRLLRELCTGMAGRFGDEYWQEIDENYGFPADFWKALTDSDLLGLALPPEYGGSGGGLLDLAIAAEALAESGAGLEGGGVLLSGPVFGGVLISRHGRPDQRAVYLPEIVGGTMWSGAFTEADSGSNISTIRTQAARRNGGYVVNGQKAFISQIRHARHVVVMARTQPFDAAAPTRGISLLVGDLPSESVEAQPLKKMGCHFMDTNLVFFNDFEVGLDCIVGEEGRAWGALFDTLNAERIVVAAAAVGTGTLAVRRAVEYATERSVWGRPIASHQGIQFPLAKAQVELAAARLKVYEAAWLFDQGRDCGTSVAMAKYSAAHAALDAADTAIQTFGGAGYITESGIERHWRNLRLNRIAPVTDEMTLSYLAQHGLGMPRSY